MTEVIMLFMYIDVVSCTVMGMTVHGNGEDGITVMAR